MRLSKTILALSVSLSAVLPAVAESSSADAPHAHVQIVIPTAALERGKPANAGLYFKLEPGWHVYWKNAGDSGLPPHVKWTLPEGVTVGALQFPAPQRLPLGPLMDFGYETEVLFPLVLNVGANIQAGAATFEAKIDWLVCREQCVPGKADLQISRPITTRPVSQLVQPDAGLFDRLSKRLPQPAPAGFKASATTLPSEFRLTVTTGKREDQGTFFPADQDVLDNPAPQKLTPNPRGLTLELKKDASLTAIPAQLSGVLELSSGRAYEISARVVTVDGASQQNNASPAPASQTKASASQNLTGASNRSESTPGGSEQLLRTIALAFLGGLVLNLMPCVFPVLFLKGLALVQSGNAERHKLRAHGFVYAAGILISFWVLVAALLILRTAGARLGWGFQFQSPIFLSLMACLLFFLGLSLAGQFEIGLTLTSAGGSLAAREGYAGSFFTGVLAVIVATPCTAPLMGAAIGYALSQPAVITFAVFTALALGLAAPYVALTLQPAWTRILPKPGAWMEVLRQAISVPIFGTVIWLAWVLADSYGALMLTALLAAFLLLAMAGWFLGRWPARRWATGVAVILAAGVVGLSVFAAHDLVMPLRAAAAARVSGDWEPWSAEAVSRYQAQGRPVFVDFTASWCLSCQVNERLALTQPEVRKAFAGANVALLRADWTQRDESIARALEQLGRNGVPAYALYSPGRAEPQLLPEVLTPGIVTRAIVEAVSTRSSR